MVKKKRLHELSWEEFKEVRKEIDTILIPIGSVEQEGPHLPLGVDSLIALEIADKVTEKAEVLVVPPIWVGYSDWHSSFPGTLSLSQETLTRMLREICSQLIEQGFKRFLFVNMHVGNDAPIAVVGNELRKKYQVLIAMVNLWALANEMAQNIEELNEKRFTHGGEIMTSVMLALYPNLVNMEKAKPEYTKSEIPTLVQKNSSRVRFQNHHVSVYRLSAEVTKSGVMGNPTGATKEKGEEIIERWIHYVTGFIKEFKQLSLR